MYFAPLCLTVQCYAVLSRETYIVAWRTQKERKKKENNNKNPFLGSGTPTHNYSSTPLQDPSLDGEPQPLVSTGARRPKG
jgi:hypothetical protein